MDTLTNKERYKGSDIWRERESEREREREKKEIFTNFICVSEKKNTLRKS